MQNPVTGLFLGDVSFDDDALYYVILPLLEALMVTQAALINLRIL